MALCGVVVVLVLVVGRVMGTVSPFFIDEFLRWLDWRFQTGSEVIVPDAYWHGRDSARAKEWRSV